MIFDYFHDDTADFTGLASYLDGLDVSTATTECSKLELKHQRALFEAAHGKRPLSLADLVPPNTTVGTQTIHQGRNTAFAFRDFQKRFGRFSVDGPIYGYNDQKFMFFTGPGYFTASTGEDGQLLLDCRRVPDFAPDNWPKPRPASQAIFPCVYRNLIDVLRGVSQRVSIGRPTYVGKEAPDSYFVLVRQ